MDCRGGLDKCKGREEVLEFLKDKEIELVHNNQVYVSNGYGEQGAIKHRLMSNSIQVDIN